MDGYFSCTCDNVHHDFNGALEQQMNGVASGRNLRGYTPIIFPLLYWR